MFDFRKKRLDPVIRQFVDMIGSALPVTRTDQAAGLLAVKSNIDTQLSKMEGREGFKSKAAFFGTLAATGGLIVAAVLMPPMAIAAGAAAGLTFMAGMITAQKYSLNRAAVANGRYVLTQKIDSEVMQAMPNFGNAANTPEFRSVLTQAFGGASNKKEFEALARHAMKNAPKAPKAPQQAPAA